MQGPKWPLFYSHLDPVWSLKLLGQVCTLGRAPRTKETLPDFYEWCRVTRHPRLFRRLTDCQRTPRFWGITKNNSQMVHNPNINTRGEVKTIPNTQQVFILLNTSKSSSRRNFIHHKPRIYTQREDSILILYN